MWPIYPEARVGSELKQGTLINHEYAHIYYSLIASST